MTVTTCPFCYRKRSGHALQTWQCGQVDCPLRSLEKQAQATHEPPQPTPYEPVFGGMKAQPTDRT